MSPTGHLAIGSIAKKYASPIPIVVFLIASYSIDLIYFIFVVLGIESFEYNPWSHSLFMSTIWSISAGTLALILCKKIQSGLVIALVVFSHWILDFIVWDNLPIYINETQRVGLGLYNKIGFTLTGMTLNSGTIIATSIELSMLLVGLAVYVLFLRKSRRDNVRPS